MPTKPPRLEPGGTIGIIAPASAPPDPDLIDKSKCALESLGYKTKLGHNTHKRWGFLAGTDRERCADLMEMFTERRVNAIICVRGGYGTARLLPLIDYDIVRKNPKIFLGYSDITSLHCAFLKKSNLVSFHGPMLASDFVKADLPNFTLHSFIRTISESTAPGSIRLDHPHFPIFKERKAPRKVNENDDSQPRTIFGGTATGPLLGGNLSVLCTTLGTPYQPHFHGKILFLEDLAEVPYRFDRMLTHLLNAGALQQIVGLAIGINANCIDPKAKDATEYRQTVEDVLRERLAVLRIPVVTGLPFGHISIHATIPIGIRALLSGTRSDLEILESAVS